MNKYMLAASAAVFFVTSFHHDICALSQNASTVNPSNVYPSTSTNPNITPHSNRGQIQSTGSTHADYNIYQRNNNLNPNATMQAKPATAETNETLVKAAADEASISTFSSALQSVDLNDILDRPGPYTIFAPSNDAFKKLNPETLSNLLKPENKAKLKEILKNHIVTGRILANDVKETTLYSLDGKPVAIKITGKDVTINGAKVTKTDILGRNGVIHIIDTVIVPKN